MHIGNSSSLSIGIEEHRVPKHAYTRAGWHKHADVSLFDHDPTGILLLDILQIITILDYRFELIPLSRLTLVSDEEPVTDNANQMFFLIVKAWISQMILFCCLILCLESANNFSFFSLDRQTKELHCSIIREYVTRWFDDFIHSRSYSVDLV